MSLNQKVIEGLTVLEEKLASPSSDIVAVDGYILSGFGRCLSPEDKKKLQDLGWKFVDHPVKQLQCWTIKVGE